jgi:hypothetical protein
MSIVNVSTDSFARSFRSKAPGARQNKGLLNEINTYRQVALYRNQITLITNKGCSVRHEKRARTEIEMVTGVLL